MVMIPKCLLCYKSGGALVQLHRRWHWVHIPCLAVRRLGAGGLGGCPACDDPIDTAFDSSYITSLNKCMEAAVRDGNMDEVIGLLNLHSNADLKVAIQKGMAFRVDKAFRTVFSVLGRRDGMSQRSVKFRELTQILKGKGSTSNLDYALICSAAADDYKMTRTLLAVGASSHTQDDQALMAAVELASTDVFRLLMSRRSAKVPVSGRVQCRAAVLDRAEMMAHMAGLGVCDQLDLALEWAVRAGSKATSKVILQYRTRQRNLQGPLAYR